MATAKPLHVVVKGSPDAPAGQQLGDCPFCHRVLLTLAAKQLPFEMTYVDFAAKPDWLVALGGKVPVLRDVPGKGDMPDSDVITVHLEQVYPEPSMASDVDPSIGAKLFPAFRGYLFAEPGEEAEKRAALDAELKLINDYLSAPGKGPLFGGDKLNATDAAVAPKLYHTQVALAHYKGYHIPAEFGAVVRYLDYIKGLDAWKQVDYGEAKIIKGWAVKH